MNNWQILRLVPDNLRLDIDSIIEILLENRSIKKVDEIKQFLNGSLDDLDFKSSGLDLEELKRAVKRVDKSVKKKETVVVYGDYDVDGVCATAILWETLYEANKKTIPYIPHRVDEGYGLSIRGIDNLLEKHPDTKLIITVDNGIVAFEAVEYANSKGIDVIVTDHHTKEKKLPYAYAIIHTDQLCGAGVSYVFSQAIKGNSVFDRHGLELVALATVADCVPLIKNNRTLLKEGIEELKNTRRLGLLEIFNLSGILQSNLGVYEIGHVIAPRLNAAGRIASAFDSLRLVCTKDSNRAKMLATMLNSSNKERQMMTEQSTTHAVTLLNGEHNQRVLVIAHESYNQGVIGLVASKLVEKFYRPTLVMSIGEKHAKGSARSVSGVNIIEMIRSVSEHVVQAGGHPMAAGFTVEIEKIEIFKQAITQKALEVIHDEHLQKKILIDLFLPFSIISTDFYKKLQYLSPFGIGNPNPVFATEKVLVKEKRVMGKKGAHLKLILEKDGSSFEAVSFNGVEKYNVSKGDEIDVAYTLDFDTWNGKNKVVLKVKDIRN